LLSRLKQAQLRLADQHKNYVPVTLKIAPDIDSEQIKNIADALLRHGIDGVIATNTTITRDAVAGLPHGEEAGGLSGKPVFELSNRVVRGLKQELGNAIPIIGAGGIFSGDDAITKMEAGASLVQVYSGLIYQGPVCVIVPPHYAACTRAAEISLFSAHNKNPDFSGFFIEQDH
jgi:dihydroorotate dehydrogenase